MPLVLWHVGARGRAAPRALVGGREGRRRKLPSSREKVSGALTWSMHVHTCRLALECTADATGREGARGPSPASPCSAPHQSGLRSALPSPTLAASSLAFSYAQRQTLSQSRARYAWQEHAASCTQEWLPAVAVWLAQWNTHQIPRVECKTAPVKHCDRWKQAARWGKST